MTYAQYQDVLALENLDKLKRDFEALRRCQSKGVRDEIIQELIDSGDILEADGNLWDLPLPTYKVKGKSAVQQLIEERESYR